MLIFSGNGVEVFREGRKIRILQDGREVNTENACYVVQDSYAKRISVPSETFYCKPVSVSTSGMEIIVRRGDKLTPKISGNRAYINVAHVLDRAGIRLAGKKIPLELVRADRNTRVYKIALNEGK